MPTQDGHVYDPGAVAVPGSVKPEHAQKTGGSRSVAGAATPTQLSQPPSPHLPESPEKGNTSLDVLTGKEELDQRKLYNLYLAMHGARSDYNVAQKYHVREDWVKMLREKYKWDEEVAKTEREDLMEAMEETSLNDIIVIHNEMLITIADRLHDSQEAREKLRSNTLRVSEVEAWSGLLLKANEMLRLADKLMELKGAAVAGIQRHPGHIFVMEDPQKAQELTEKYTNDRLSRQKTANAEDAVQVVE